jgi:hypothetical protein
MGGVTPRSVKRPGLTILETKTHTHRKGNLSQSNPARQVKLDRDVPGESGEIGIGRENL